MTDILTVFSVASMQGDRFQVKAAVKIDSSHDVPSSTQHKHHENCTIAGTKSLLKRRDKTATGLRSTRSCSRGGRRDSSAVCGGRASRSATVQGTIGLESGVARRGQLIVAAGKGQGARSNEALSLVGIGRVSVNAVHFCDCSRMLSRVPKTGRGYLEQI